LNTPQSENYVYVRDPVAMDALIERVGAAERVGLDTEADSLHNYFEKVWLIQLSLGSEHYIVDPLAGLELGGFLEALAEKPLILHGGDYDLRMMRASLGLRSRREVFDTMIAAQLLGMEQGNWYLPSGIRIAYNLRRPYWLPRSYKPALEAYYFKKDEG
jgi:ribonuclease D